MNRYQSTLGIIINKKTLGDKDLLITLITPRLGKITALAKGVRNIKSRRLGSLQLGNTIKANLYSKGHHLWITETQTISPFLKNPKNLAQLSLLFYFLEIVNRLVADNQHLPGVYSVVAQTTQALHHRLVPDFLTGEINFLRLLGFGLPPEITDSFRKRAYKATQKHLLLFFESLIEKPLESPKLFR